MPNRASWDGDELRSLNRQKHVLHQFDLQLWSRKAAWDREQDPADLGVCKDRHSLNRGWMHKAKSELPLNKTKPTP